MTLGERMKEYELQSRTRLLKKTPVIIRLDGKSFHTLCKGLDKPFDYEFMKLMQKTMLELCSNIQGCVLGYTQSDEITLVLVDFQNIDTQPWFDNRVQKMVSVSASLATLYFNKYLTEMVNEKRIELERAESCYAYANKYKENLDFLDKWENKQFKGTFDSRTFNLPKEEVVNNLIWRQQDATRNSINSVAQSLFSPKEIKGIKSKDLQNKMLVEKDVNWNDTLTSLKRGSCAIKDKDNNWFIDTEIPIFTENKEYINNLIEGY